MTFGSIWGAFGEPLGSFVGSKMLRTSMFFLDAFCMLSGSRAGGTQAGSAGGAEGDLAVFGLQGRIQEGEAKVLGT